MASSFIETLVSWHNHQIDWAVELMAEKSRVLVQHMTSARNASDEHRRFLRESSIDDVAAVISRIASSSASSSSRNGGAQTSQTVHREITALRVQQLEDVNALLRKDLEAAKAEIHQQKLMNAALVSREKKRLTVVPSQLQASEPPSRVVSSSSHVSISTQTTTSAHTKLREAVANEAIAKLQLQELCARHAIATEAIVWFLSLQRASHAQRIRIGELLLVEMQRKWNESCLEKEMLHDELTLCLRRISQLEAEPPIVVNPSKMESSDAAVATDLIVETVDVGKRSENDDASHVWEEVLFDSQKLKMENARLHALLKRYAAAVAAVVMKNAVTCDSS